MQAVLIVNPYSSGMTSVRERAIVKALREYLHLDVKRTERSGHATQIAQEAVDAGVDLIIACGGDGTGNEVLNGMQLATGTATARPYFTLIPAGGTNVLCRSLGMPNHPVKAARLLAPAVAARRHTTINLGMLDERLFMFSAGVGFDGELVRRIEDKRKGRRPSDLAHFRTVLGIFLYERFVLDDRMSITIDATGEQLRAGLLMCGNTAPLSYIGKMSLDFLPDARIDAGLDFMAPARVSFPYAMRNSFDAMGLIPNRFLDSEKKQIRTDLDGFTVVCDEAQPCQADGEYVGDRTHIRFSVVREAVRFIH